MDTIPDTTAIRPVFFTDEEPVTISYSGNESQIVDDYLVLLAERGDFAGSLKRFLKAKLIVGYALTKSFVFLHYGIGDGGFSLREMVESSPAMGRELGVLPGAQGSAINSTTQKAIRPLIKAGLLKRSGSRYYLQDVSKLILVG